MTNTEITPELLRRVVNHPDAPAEALIPLAQWADRVERGQAAEKRIDELARIFWDASVKDSGFEPAWESVAADAKPYYRAGIRAVLANLEQEGKTPKYDQGGIEIKPFRQWSDLRHIPEDVDLVEDFRGQRWQRPPGGWGSCPVSTQIAPLTEVIADA